MLDVDEIVTRALATDKTYKDLAIELEPEFPGIDRFKIATMVSKDEAICKVERETWLNEHGWDWGLKDDSM